MSQHDLLKHIDIKVVHVYIGPRFNDLRFNDPISHVTRQPHTTFNQGPTGAYGFRRV